MSLCDVLWCVVLCAVVFVLLCVVLCGVLLVLYCDMVVFADALWCGVL